MLFKNANVFIDGSFVLTDLSVSKEKISTISGDDIVIDCSGKFIIPGLFDCHIHLFSDPFTWDRQGMLDRSQKQLIETAGNNMRILQNAGVTFFRDCGGYRGYEFELAHSENLPDYMLCGSALCITGGHCYWSNHECDGADGFVKGAREEIRKGADFIKLMLTGGFARKSMGVNHTAPSCPVQMSSAEIAAVTEECHRRGYRISAHCVGIDGIREAINAGIDSIEHGQFFDTSDAEIPTLLEQMKAKSMTVVPTMAAYYKNYNKKDVADQYRYVDESLMLYHNAGVKIALGTDAGCPQVGYDSAITELLHIIDAGVSVTDAITYATATSAELLGVEDEYGKLLPNYYADLVIFEGDAEHNIPIFNEITAVYKKGVCVK